MLPGPRRRLSSFPFEGACVKLAIATPVLNMIVGVAPEWERTGSIEDVARIAERGRRAGLSPPDVQ